MVSEPLTYFLFLICSLSQPDSVHNACYFCIQIKDRGLLMRDDVIHILNLNIYN